MRGRVAISVTATPAAAPRRIREVLRIIIREPPGLRLRPTMGLDRFVSHPYGLHVEYAVVSTARFGNGPLGSAAQHCDGPARLPRTAPSQRISVPSQQSRHDIRRPLLDEGRPIEQAEQSEHLSRWQRYLAMTSNLNRQHVKCKCVLHSVSRFLKGYPPARRG